MLMAVLFSIFMVFQHFFSLDLRINLSSLLLGIFSALVLVCFPVVRVGQPQSLAGWSSKPRVLRGAVQTCCGKPWRGNS